MSLAPINTPKTAGGTIISRSWTEEWVKKVEEVERKKGWPICGAATRQDSAYHEVGAPCHQRAGTGTPHLGEGRCKWHGGLTPVKSGKYSLLSHTQVSRRVEQFLDSTELMSIRNAVATSWAVIDTLLEEDAVITPDRAQEILTAMSRIGNLIKQHHDITEGQKIMIEVPQFMEWAEHLYELAIKYILLSGGDTRGFLSEAQRYYTSAVAIVTGDSPPALGVGDSEPSEELLRSGEPYPGGEASKAGPDLLRGEVHQTSRPEMDEGDPALPDRDGSPPAEGEPVRSGTPGGSDSA